MRRRSVLLFALLFLGLAVCPGVTHADVLAAICQTGMTTGTGTLNLCPTPVSFTPKAALVFVSYATANNSVADGGLLSFGSTDCTSQWTAPMRTRDTGSTSASKVVAKTTALIKILLKTNDTTDAEATFSSCSAGQVVINISNAAAASYLITTVLFGGTDVAALVGTVTSNTAIDGIVDTTTGLTCGTLFLAGQRQSFNDVTQTLQQSWGVFTANGQAAWGWADQESLATTVVTSGITGTYANATPSAAAWPNQQILISAIANGFRATTKTATGTKDYGYLCLEHPGVRAWAGILTTPTSPGALATTGPGWVPQFAMLGMTGAAALDASESDDDAGYVGVSLNTATAQYSLAVASDDATATADTKSMVDNTAIRVLSATGAALFTGTWTSFDATGATWTLSATDGTARKWWGYALEVTPPPAVVRGGIRQWW